MFTCLLSWRSWRCASKPMRLQATSSSHTFCKLRSDQQQKCEPNHLPRSGSARVTPVPELHLILMGDKVKVT